MRRINQIDINEQWFSQKIQNIIILYEGQLELKANKQFCIILKNKNQEALVEQKYHYNQPTNRLMKGVKINNYIDNRIVLSGRKLKNQVQTLIQGNRPRPLLIRHLNYLEEEEDPQIHSEQKQTLKAIDQKSTKKKKKKVKTSSNINNINGEINVETQAKEQKKIKGRKQSIKRVNSAKKRSDSSSPSGFQIGQLNETQKKLRVVSKTGEGLGKRSKSAIIKSYKSPSNGLLELEKKNQQINLKANNPAKKKESEGSKKKPKKQKKSKGKELKKNLSTLNVSDKKKIDKDTGVKTSRVTSKPTNSKNSKPVSARDHKKSTNFFSKSSEKNLIQSKSDKDPITLEQLLNIQKSDRKLKGALLKLQEAINSGGSRKKLSQKLQLLAEKLKEIEDIGELPEKTNSQTQKQDRKQIEQFFPSDSQRNEQYKKKEELRQFTNAEIISKVKQREQEQFIQSSLNNKIKENDFSEENRKEVGQEQQGSNQDLKGNRNSEQQQQDAHHTKKEKSESQQEYYQQLKYYDEFQLNEQSQIIKNNYIKNPDLHRKQQLNRNKAFQQTQQNPLLSRKGGADVQLVDYDSINSVKSNQDQDKKQEISQLKKFQEESDLMMKRIRDLQSKRKSEVIIQQKGIQNNQIIKIGEGSPRNLQIKNYAFQRYPTLEQIKSPKINTQQIIDVIKLKEKVVTDRHEKLSELVNVLFDKKMVSPKTYSIQMQSLREQQIINNEVLDNYRKHAQELAQLLSDIKKEKQEISTIDEIIRSQKWNEAVNVMKVPKNDQQMPSEKKDLRINKSSPSQLSNSSHSQSQQSEAIYYQGEDSEASNTIRLIQVEEQKQQKGQTSEKNINIIIDEQSQKQVKKRRGFDSNLFFIKQYCIALCEFVRDYHKGQFRKRIGSPMQYDLVKLLETFRINKDGSIPLMINSLYEDLSYHQAKFHINTDPISEQIFEQFNKQYGSLKYYGKEVSEDAKLEGIFLKSIFNALNQSINIEKPGGANGKALPWANTSKHLKNLKNSLKNSQEEKFKNQQSEDLIFGIAIARIIQWGSCLCGFIPDTVELQNTQIDEEYINHIRQTRTALLLEKMLADEEQTMYKTELVETEVKLYLSQLIAQQLCRQTVQEMRKINLRSTLRSVDY